MLPVGDGVSDEVAATVSDAGAAGDGYEMVGIPDGLGAYKEPDSRDFTLLMNQELRTRRGAPPRPGRRLRRELEIDGDTYAVEEGSDLIDPDIRYWDYPSRRTRRLPRPGRNPRDPSDTFLAQPRGLRPFLLLQPDRAPASCSTQDTGAATAARSTSPTRRTATKAGCSGSPPTARRSSCRASGLFAWENTLAARQRDRHDARDRSGGRGRRVDLGLCRHASSAPATRSTRRA